MAPSAAEMIVRRSKITADDTVLEIGSGLGALTIPAAKAARQVYAVETDPQLNQLMKSELAVHQLKNVEIIEKSILHIDIGLLAQKLDQRLTVIGNLPYNISSQILIQLVQARHHVNRAILMFQKELSQRIRATPGNKNYGRLTVMLAYCAEIRSIATMPASLFYPKPKVDSEIVEINFNISREYPPHDEAMLFQVVKAAFGTRRKTLKNALLTGGLPIEPRLAREALIAAQIDPGRRAETLSVSEFIALQISLVKIFKSK